MFEWVPTAVLDRIVQEVFSPELARRGFEQTDRRKWVRSTKIPIREVLILHAMKSMDLTPVWGVSLDFVPHISACRVRWHRTTKSARLDLCYDPIDYEENASDERVAMPRLFGSTESRRAARAMVESILQPAERFFAPIRGIPDLPAAFEEKRNRLHVRFGFLNYVQEPLAYAFTLAKLGREQQARQWLGIAKEYHRLDRTESRKLRDAFKAALCGTDGDTA